MLRTLCITLVLLALFLPRPARGEDEPAGGGITWEKDLAAAMGKAKETGRILMICINAKHVDGRKDEEPAAKGLREVVYVDKRIVERSRAFVCVMMTPKSSVADHGVLGNLGVEDPLISPQHIFVGPEGKRVLYRREYWPYGKGEKAIEALLGMMKKAEDAASQPEVPAEAEKEDSPADEAARAEWILSMLEKVKGETPERNAALDALVREDRDGDCTGPLIELLGESKKDVELLKALIRALGRNDLEAAAEPIAEFLGHRDESIRGNAAVSLEYIGSTEKKVVSALLKAAGREKDEVIANHMFRALGRCGVEDSGAKATLLKAATNGKSEFATYGPLIGLAYFEGDAKAARGVEKILELIGIPGGGRGGWQNTLKRALASWTLASIGDEKSEKFVRDELMAKLEKVQAFWVEGMLGFWDSVARTCGGQEDAMGEVEGGVRFTVGIARGPGRSGEDAPSMSDDCRQGRDELDFKPKGEGLLDSGERD